MNIMISIFPFLFVFTFLLVFGMILFAVINGATRWNKNNKSPVLTVDVLVVSKRTSVSHRHHSDNFHHHSSTRYYVTFQVQSGDRMEFNVPGNEYGMMVEGDVGKLTFQGTRFLRFDRQR